MGVAGRSPVMAGVAVVAVVGVLLSGLPGAAWARSDVPVPAVSAAALVPLPAAGGPVEPAALGLGSAGVVDDTQEAKAKARASGSMVEITAGRSENSTTFATPDGKLMTSLSAQPVRVWQGGGWVPVDTTLVASGGGLGSRATVGGLQLSVGGGPVGGPVATLDDGVGHAVSVGWPLPLPAPSVVGDSATYRGVEGNSDLVFRATAAGFEQSVVLRSRPSVAPLIRLPLGGRGYVPVASDSGGVDLLDATDPKLVVGRVSPAVMFGAELGARSGEPTRSAKVASRVVMTPAGPELQLLPDLAFLLDPSVTYPVTVDPFVQLGQTGHTYVDSGYNTGYPADPQLKVGTYDGGGHVNRSLLSFNWAGLRSARVVSASLWVFENWSWSCAPSPVELWDTGYFDGSTVWSNAPPPYGLQASQTVAFGYSAGCAADWVSFEASRLAQAWSDGGYATTYAMLKAPNEQDNYQWKKFDASSARFDVTYDDPSCTYYPQTGKQVCGAIRAHYNALGGPNALGFPITDETTTPDGVGRYNHFQSNTSIYWTPTLGAWGVGGAIRGRWEALGWESGVLGYPTTDETTTPDGVGRYNHFQNNGSIYWSPSTGAWEVYGAIRVKWSSMGWERSCLGYPISGEYPVPGGRRNDFQGGSITWLAASGETASCQPAQPPGGPAAPVASAGDSEANVRFTPPRLNGSPVTGYTVTASPGGRTASAGPDGRLVTVTGLTNGTSYTFTVRADSAAGAGPQSPPSNAVVPSAGVNPTPGNPSNPEVVEPDPMPMPAPGTGRMPNLADGPRQVVPGAAAETLGLEAWQSYRSTALGGQGRAEVNVASGNLVAQVLDSTAVQAHGRLSYALRRTYNSQQPVGLLASPGSIGAGWTLSLGEQAGDVSTVGVAGQALLGVNGGLADGGLSALTPGAVSLVDRDGTAHLFTPQVLGTALASPLLSELLGGQSDQVLRRALIGTPGALVCVDTAYSSPLGVHASLLRFIQLGSGSNCPSAGAARPAGTLVLGYALVRPDRVRTEFNATGQIMSMTDGAGVELRYRYETELAPGVSAGRLLVVYEPASCTYTQPGPNQAGGLPAGCRAFRLDYTDPNAVKVSDPAGRVTVYGLSPPAVPGGVQYLQRVTNPDGSTLTYRYNQVAGPDGQAALGCSPTVGALCQATDGRGSITSFGYADDGNPATLDKAKVTSVVDRRGLTSTLAYGQSITTVTAGAGSTARTTVYAGIDSAGRVGRVLEGDPAGVLYRDTVSGWDTTGASCSQPTNRIDHNRCALSRAQTSTAAGAAPSQRTETVFNEQGLPLITRRASGGGGFDTTTAGFRTQHIRASATSVYTDSVRGGGQVDSGPARTDTPADPTLFTVTDRVESLTARGNTAADWPAYATSFTVDADPAQRAGVAPVGGVCTGQAGNTGLVCASTGPAFDGSGAPTVTRFSYDQFGQRIRMTTPKANAETPAGQSPPAYRYEYFADGDRDVTGMVSAGGWLRAVTDPTGAFVAYGYDRAGNPVRTWDRNATAGRAPPEFPGPLTSPPSTRFSEQLYGPTSAGREVDAAERQAALERPWRFVRSDRDPLGNRTVTVTDPNGNVTALTSPRGTQSVPAGQAPPPTFTTVTAFDAGDLPSSVLQPANRQVNGADTDRPSRISYTEHGQPSLRTDPRGVNTAFDYDNAGRLVASIVSRGPGSQPAPRACRVSTSTDAPRFASGVVLCTSRSALDGLDQVFAAQDRNGQVSTASFDALGRPTATVTPRGGGQVSQPLASVRTETLYNPDGQPTSVCRPRQASEASGGCTPTARFASHTDYDLAGRPSAVRSYRDASGPALTTRTGFDADGNPVTRTDAAGNTSTASFDLLGRPVSLTRPRQPGVANTVSYGYDPVGNRTSVSTPTEGGASRVDAYGYDAANRAVETVTGASSPVAAQAGVLAADGGSNSRTRRLFDADGYQVGVFSPNAFTSSTSTPDGRYLTRTDVDSNGRPTAAYQPRFDRTAGGDDPTGGAGGQAGAQAAQCPTGATPNPVSVPASMSPVPGYDPSIGVCVTRTGYDSAGQPTTLTLPTAGGAQPGATSRQTALGWTDDGLLARRTSPSPTGVGTATVTTRFDGVGRPLTVTDPLGQVTVSTWTADGLPAVHTPPGYTPTGSATPVSHRSVQAYDADGNPAVSTDALGQQTTRSYTPDGLLTQLTAPGASSTSTLTTRYGYDRVGNLTEVFSPSAVAADATNPAGAPTRYEYFADDLLAAVTVPVQTTASGVVSSRRTTWAYDGAGRKLSQRADQVDAAGVVTASAGTQRFGYYPNSALQTETGRAAETISYAYDGFGNPTSVADSTNPAAQVNGTFYLDGRPRTVTDGTTSQAETTGYAYDGSGQVLRRSQGPSGGPAGLSAYTYTDAGTPARASSSVVTQSGSANWVWNQDAAGRPVSETAPNGQVTRWSYQPDSTVLTKTTRAGGGGADPVLASWTYGYDNLFRQTTAEHSGLQPGGANGNQRHTFNGYDPAGRITAWADDQGEHTASYDSNNNRLSVATVNKPTQTSTYRADDSIATATDGAGGPALASSYDSAGNLTADGCYTNSYDGFDRITTASPELGGCATAPARAATSYRYDGLDRQRSRTQTTTSSTIWTYSDNTSRRESTTSTATTALSYDGLTSQAVTQTTTPAGGVAEPAGSYTLSPAGQPISLTSNTPAATEYLTDDGHGSITTISRENPTNPNTAISCATRFDPWGTPRTDPTLGSSTAADAAPTPTSTDPRTTRTGNQIGLAPHPCQTSSTDGSASSGNDMFYRGQRRDPGTGTYQLGSRSYDPAKAAFLSHDTYRQAQPGTELALGTDPLTRNRYAYLNGDPINQTDPTGHDPRPNQSSDPRACDNGACSAQAQSREYGSTMPAAARETRDRENPAPTATPHQDGGGGLFGKVKAFAKVAAPFVVGAVVFAGCTAATGGAGAIGCAALGGAAYGATHAALNCNGDASCIVSDIVTNAAIGAVTAGVGQVAVKGARAVAPQLTETISGAVSQTAARATEPIKAVVAQATSSVKTTLARVAGRGSTAIAQRGAAEAGEGVAPGIPNAARSRPSFRRGTERDALQSAPRAPDGGPVCVGCGTPLGRGQIEYGGRLRRDFDLDHYGQTWAERARQMPHDITRPEVNDAYQVDIRALCPVCNQSHRMEGVP